jgi:hypothetical protein
LLPINRAARAVPETPREKTFAGNKSSPEDRVISFAILLFWTAFLCTLEKAKRLLCTISRQSALALLSFGFVGLPRGQRGLHRRFTRKEKEEMKLKSILTVLVAAQA